MGNQDSEQITAAQYEDHLIQRAKIYIQTFKSGHKDLWDIQGSWRAAGFNTESISHEDIDGEGAFSKLRNLPTRDFEKPISNAIVMVGQFDYLVQVSFIQQGARTGVPVIFSEHPHSLLDESRKYLDLLSWRLESEARRIAKEPSESRLVYLIIHHGFDESLRLKVTEEKPDCIQIHTALQTWCWPTVTDRSKNGYGLRHDTFQLGSFVQLDYNQCLCEKFHGVIAVFDRDIDSHLENMAKMCIRLGMPPKENF